MSEKNIKTEFFNDCLNSKKIVFFGGAGVSTKSGIPDFRSSSGIIKQNNDIPVEEILSKDFLYSNPEKFFKFYFDNLVYLDAKPNNCHKTLKYMEDINILDAIVTQNIDGLHQKAGSKNVYELHGTIYKNYSVESKKEYPIEYLINQKDKPYPVDEDGFMIRPNIVLYGEPSNVNVVNEAVDKIEKADVLIIAGTSLSVFPACALVRYYLGDKMYLINKDDIKFAGAKFIKGDVDEIFKELYDFIKENKKWT